MPRKPASPADHALVAYARDRGVAVTPGQLERWRATGLLMGNLQRRLGRGKGSTSVPADEAGDLVVWLGRHAAPGRRPHDLALLAFAEGLRVPDDTVRAAFRATVDQVVFPAEREAGAPADGDRSDWVWSVAEQTVRDMRPGVWLPARVRRIDERIAQAGVSWAPTEAAPFDKGPTAPEPATRRDLAAFSLAAVLGGGTELSGPAVATYLRALLPEGAVSPAASMVEYPTGDRPGPAEINDGAGLSLLPTGDVRDDFRAAVDAATLGELRAAWQAASDMRAWALALCDAVEAELDTGQLGDAILEWMLGAAVFGLPRLLLCDVLRERRASPASQATTAVLLLWVGVAFGRLRILVPDAQFDLLPVMVPAFMHPLIGIAGQPTEPVR